MKKVLIATTNKNKVNRIKKLFTEKLASGELEFISMNDIPKVPEEPAETGSSGMENAKIKAQYYYDNLAEKLPVLSQDDTIFIEGIPEDVNPGADIKAPVIEKHGEFNDENAYTYYTELFEQYGGALPIEFRYGFALATENGLFAEPATLPGRVLSTISEKRTPGYFLADMMQVEENGEWKYYNELTDEELVAQDHSLRTAIQKLLQNV